MRLLDGHYLDFCHHDGPFYDRPPTNDDFALTGAAVPAGWSREADADWIRLSPVDTVLPGQGWQVHVSATPDTAARVLARSWDFCHDQGVAVAFLPGVDHLRRRTGRYAERGTSGTVLTAFPVDDTALARVLDGLGRRLHGEAGPSVLGGLRWRDGPLYVRYGGFRPRYAFSPTGEWLPCIVDGTGNLVPDLPRPGFRPPSWLPLPAVLTTAVAASTAGNLRDFPYQVTAAMHVGTGGGVYRAVDTRSRAGVLLKQARPHAGLDAEGRSATDRLRRERWALQTLAGLPCVPELVDFREGRDHSYLVREYVHATPVSRLVDYRNPLLRTPTTGRLSPVDGALRYTTWALDVLDRVERGLAAIGERGVELRRLRPATILVTPGGRIVFVGLSEAYPGHTRPDGAGAAFGLLCAAMFLPATPGEQSTMVGCGPDSTERREHLLRLIAELFAVPAGFVTRIRRALGPATGPPHPSVRPAVPPPAVPPPAVPPPAVPVSAVWPEPGLDTWSYLSGAIVRGILDAATPDRQDRLYPGDVRQFHRPGAGIGFAHGAAGVLWALHRVGAAVPAEHRDWLLSAVDRLGSGTSSTATPNTVMPNTVMPSTVMPNTVMPSTVMPGTVTPSITPGFADGLSGIAYALAELGHPDQAWHLLDRATALPRDGVTAALADGLAGLGLTWLYRAGHGGGAAAVHRAERIAGELAGFTDRYRPTRPGLSYGPAGHALFLLRLYEHTGERHLLDRAHTALATDAALFGWPDGSPGWQHRHGLAGPIGTAMVIAELLRHTDDADLAAAREAFCAAAQVRSVPGCGSVRGRAGTVLGLHHLTGPARAARPGRQALRRHLIDLGWHAVRAGGDTRGFVGESGLRLSTDLATGSAGVLLAVHTVLHGLSTPVPFFSTDGWNGPARP